MFDSGYFIEYLLSRADVKAVWDEFVHHPFVMGLGDGKLPLESFKGYIIQDYLYLVRPLIFRMIFSILFSDRCRFTFREPMPSQRTNLPTLKTLPAYVLPQPFPYT